MGSGDPSTVGTESGRATDQGRIAQAEGALVDVPDQPRTAGKIVRG